MELASTRAGAVLAAPAGTATAPAGTVTAPMGTVAAPAGTATVPAGTVAVPAGTEALQAGTMSPRASLVTPPRAPGAIPEGEEEPARQAGGQGLLAGGVDEELHGGETLAGYALGLEDLGRLLGQGLDLG